MTRYYVKSSRGIMPCVEFIYDSDCPNVTAARSQLLRAFAEAGISATWQEWERNDPNNPDYVKQFGSPTILVDGIDISAAEPGDKVASCRIYRHADGTTSGVPPLEKIILAISTSAIQGAGKKKRWLSLLSSVFSGILVLFPKAACPA